MGRLLARVAMASGLAALTACGGARIVESGSAPVSMKFASARASPRTARIRALIYADHSAARRASSNSSAVCGMLDAMPAARNAAEAAFLKSYLRAMKAHADCPLIGIPATGRLVQSRTIRSNHCYDWTTQDPNGSGQQVPGGADYSGCPWTGPGAGAWGVGNISPPTVDGGGGGSASGTAIPFNAAILNAAQAQNGKSDRGFVPAGTSCRVGCVYTVNGIIQQATGETLCGNINNTDQIKSCAQTALVSQATSMAGDLIIVDSPDGKDGHVGVCLNNGCTQMNSNSSSHCTFTFSNKNFDYPGSPYHNGYITYWRMIS